MEFTWRNYETLALWIHESCHFNPEAIDSHLKNLSITTTNTTTAGTTVAAGDTYDDDDDVNNNTTTFEELSSIRGFCSRTKFRHLYEHIQSTDEFTQNDTGMWTRNI